MRRPSIAALLLLALLASLRVACASHAGWEPIELDVSRKATASVTPAAAAATPTPGIVPAPTAEPPAPARPPVAVPTTAPVPTVAPVLPPASAARGPQPPATPEAVARAREDAFNRHDLDALAALYAPDAKIFDPPDRLRDSGAAAIRESFAR